MLGTGMLVAGFPVYLWNQSLNAKPKRGQVPADDADVEGDEDRPS
ncbi:MAG: hypothetical protein ACI87O_002022 [Planctomycetota bacterium]|jgi:hypothetical protein